MVLAIFDLDNTLIAGDSDHSWGEFLIDQGMVDPDVFKQKNDQFYSDYQNGTLDIYAYQEFALSPIVGIPMEELTIMHQQFMRDFIGPMMLPKAQTLIADHASQGHTLLIITATNRFVTQPIADALNISNLLATEPEILEDRYTGKIVGTPCFQQGKVKRLNEWLTKTNTNSDVSYFYSDSANDLPLLETVDYPIAVDPDERLEKIASEKKWPIISLRQ